MRSLDAIKNVGVTSVTIIILQQSPVDKRLCGTLPCQLCVLCATLLSQIINFSRLVM